LSLEDTVGTLAAFADHALIGSDAGTSLKVMLQRLTPQSDEARAMMDRLGFTAYDSQGKFVGLTKLAGNLQGSFKNLTPEARNAAFATIFGSDAVRSATILYELGAQGIQKYTKAVNDQGAAGRMAAIQTDNLVGDLQRLRGAIEVALIESGSAANGTLRTMTQWITRLVNAYNSLPSGVQHAVTLFTGIGGAATLAVTGFMLLLPRIAATRTALRDLGVTAARTRTVLGVLGQVTAVVAGLELISIATQAVRDQFKDAPPSVSKLANSFVDLGKSGKVNGEALKKLGSDLGDFGEAVKRVAHPDWEARTTDIVNSLTMNLTKGMAESQIPLDEAHDKIEAVDSALAELASGGNAELAAKSFDQLAEAAAKDGTSKEKLLTLLPQYTDALAGVDTQNKTAGSSQAELAKQLGMTADEMQDQRSEAEKLADALKGLNGTNISAAEQEIQFRQSLADLTSAVKDNGHSLDVTSEKGRKVKAAFLDAAKAAMEHAQSVAEQKNSQEAGQKVLEQDISLLRKQMAAAGFSKDAIDKLTAAYLRLPGTVTTKVDAKTQQAISDLEAVKKKVESTKGKTITVNAPTKEARAQLEALGFKIKSTKGKQVTITVPTGGQKAAVDALRRAIEALRDKAVTVTTHYKITGTPGRQVANSSSGGHQFEADGGVLQSYAGGGMRENHVAQIAPAGAWRVWAEEETGGEAYIPLARSKRSRSRKIAAQAVRMLGGEVAWFAGGGIPGFTYTPTGQAVLGGPGNAKQRYDELVNRLRDAWREYQDALKERDKVLKDKKSTKKERDAARRAVAKEYADVKALDKTLGLRSGAPAPTTFNLAAYQKQLGNSLAATEWWRKNLEKIGRRGGEDIKALLEAMGEDGYALVNSLAGASDKQFKDITNKLMKTGELAKATLADFTKQLGASTKENQQFAADLQKLAAQGFGDLAQALAAQGDANAMALAHQAAGNSKDAAAANKAVGSAQSTLTGDDLANSLVLLSTLRGGTGRGFADLIAAGLDVATIKALVPKMSKQIAGLPGPYKDTFVRQWIAQGGQPMAVGGILTRPTMVLGGEAGVPESWIPWTSTARSRALLAKTASAMGYHLVPAGRYRSSGGSAAALAREVTKQITVNLYGARQTTAEQAHDIARHMQFVG
jgi:hypothetical protein